MMCTRLLVQITTTTLLLVALTIAGCSGGGEGQGGGFQMPPTMVEAGTVTRQTVTDDFDAVGTIEAINAIQVVSEVAGKVTGLPFTEGGTLQKGDVIVQLDDDQASAEYEAAKASYEYQKVTFDRIKAIYDKGASSQQDYDAASTSLKMAEAAMGVAKARLAKTRITAPFSGKIGAKLVSIGEYVEAGKRIADLAQLDELKVTFSAPERYYPLLQRGAPVIVWSPAFPDMKLQGKIDVIEPVVDESTRSVNIVAKLKNPDGLFRPGMSANVKAVLSQRDNALVIPSEAVVAQGGQTFVFVIGEDGSANMTPVKLGSRTATAVEVVSGLSEGQQIVKAGHQKLYPGAKVMTGPPPGMGGGGGQQAAPAAESDGGAPTEQQGEQEQHDSTMGDK